MKKIGLPAAGYTLEANRTISPELTLRHLVVETSEEMRNKDNGKQPAQKAVAEKVRGKVQSWLEDRLQTTLWESKKTVADSQVRTFVDF